MFNLAFGRHPITDGTMITMNIPHSLQLNLKICVYISQPYHSPLHLPCCPQVQQRQLKTEFYVGNYITQYLVCYGADDSQSAW